MRRLGDGLVVALLALVGIGCGDRGDDVPKRAPALSVMGVWSGPEQASFEAVIAGFEQQSPGVRVRYTSAGDQLPTQLATAVEGGNPPDLAVLPQPGLMADLVRKAALLPLEFARSEIAQGFAPGVVGLGEVQGQLYGLLFKASNKSTVWYNARVFEDAGVKPPKTWEELLATARTIGQSGVPAYSIAGADGWTLTDLFENLYLRIAGAERYDRLARHEIPWTDESVKRALREMARVVGDAPNLAGGTSGALQTDFPTSVSQAFASPARASMVFEGDFVADVVRTSTRAELGRDCGVFEFPSVAGSLPVVMGGGDLVVLLRDGPSARAFVRYLATAGAAQIWARRGGFSSLHVGLGEDVYPDAVTRSTAGAFAAATTFRFDLSDLQPAEFGSTVGQGLSKLFQDFLRDPGAVDEIAERMERAAAEAHGR